MNTATGNASHGLSLRLVAAVCFFAALFCAKAAPRSVPTGATYHNPILFADYSDPDVIRDGANYYLVASTFHFVPAIPILQSTDLVHWTILGSIMASFTCIFPRRTKASS
jgi:beta-xylosidase